MVYLRRVLTRWLSLPCLFVFGMSLGCAGQTQLTGAPESSAMSQDALLAIADRNIDGSIVGSDRDLLKSVIAMHLSKASNPAVIQNFNEILVIAEPAGDRILVNRLELKDTAQEGRPVPGEPNVFTDSKGRQFVFPDDPYPIGTEGLQPASIPIVTNEGPYRRMISQSGYMGESIQVSLPCANSINPTTSDTPYFYSGGFSSGYSNEVEAGFQYSPTNKWYTAYLKLFGGSPSSMKTIIMSPAALDPLIMPVHTARVTLFSVSSRSRRSSAGRHKTARYTVSSRLRTPKHVR